MEAWTEDDFRNGEFDVNNELQKLILEVQGT